MEEECTICLEPLINSKLGVITCNHYYHESCILTWSKNSNSCPSCRKLFYNIDIRNSPHSDTFKSFRVQDRLLANDAINHIPSEFVIPAQSPPQLVHQLPDDEPLGICSICSSSDYRSSSYLIECFGCSCKFHPNCLGLDDEDEWSCPMCDYRQDFIVQRRNTRRCLGGNAKTRKYRATAKNAKANFSEPTPNRTSLSDSKLIIHNENGELDDQFLYENENETTAITPVINGGVLRRKEIKQLANLSFDEIKSWESFDKIRKNQEQESEVSITPPTRRRRKRRQIEPITNQGPLNVPSAHSKSRISDLMQRIKANRSEYPEAVSPSSVNSVFTVDEKHNISPNSSPTSPSISPNLSPTLLPGSPSSSFNPLTLTYEQKSLIQTFIRDHLRPLYQSKVIRCEQDYININKNASHKIYLTILTSKTQQIFTNANNELKTLVDKYLDNEIKEYTNYIPDI